MSPSLPLYRACSVLRVALVLFLLVSDFLFILMPSYLFVGGHVAKGIWQSSMSRLRPLVSLFLSDMNHID